MEGEEVGELGAVTASCATFNCCPATACVSVAATMISHFRFCLGGPDPM